jgi:hypothetical protein
MNNAVRATPWVYNSWHSPRLPKSDFGRFHAYYGLQSQSVAWGGECWPSEVEATSTGLSLILCVDSIGASAGIDRREGQINTYKPRVCHEAVVLRLCGTETGPSFPPCTCSSFPSEGLLRTTMADESDIRREIGQVSDHVSYSETIA